MKIHAPRIHRQTSKRPTTTRCGRRLRKVDHDVLLSRVTCKHCRDSVLGRYGPMMNAKGRVVRVRRP